MRQSSVRPPPEHTCPRPSQRGIPSQWGRQCVTHKSSQSSLTIRPDNTLPPGTLLACNLSLCGKFPSISSKLGGKQHARSKIRSVFAGQLTRQHAPGNPPGPSHLTHTHVRSIFSYFLKQTNSPLYNFYISRQKHFTILNTTYL